MPKRQRGRGRPKKMVATTPRTVVRAILQQPTPSIDGGSSSRDGCESGIPRSATPLPVMNNSDLPTPPTNPALSETQESHESASLQSVEPKPTAEIDCVSSEIGDKGRDWENMVIGNRTPGHGAAVGYSSPAIVNGEVEVVLEIDDIQSELDYWKHSLIMYVVADELSMNGVRQFMSKVSNFAALPELY